MIYTDTFQAIIFKQANIRRSIYIKVMTTALIRKLYSFALAFLALSIASHAAAQNNESPNIVLIMSDYMGYSDIGPYGATDIQTPSLNTLAEQGVTFSNYYSAAPVCGPSRAALLSGLYPAKVGMQDNIATISDGLAAEDSSLVKGLKQAGYRTAMVGKWHLGQEGEFSPNTHGFDSFFGFHTWTLGYHDHRTPNGLPGLYRNEELIDEDGYLTTLFTDEAVDFIADESDAPFFLYLSYNTGLPPYQRPDLPEPLWHTGWDVNQASREDYVAMVESMDQGIGRVLNSLENASLTDNTLVIFTYDHGGRHLVDSEPLFHGFATLWEGGIRVPLIMRWPDQINSGQDIEQTSIAMDLTATMLAAAGQTDQTLDGADLLPTLQNQDAENPRTLFWQYGPMWATRQGKWKYVLDNGTQFLFDLEEDIAERDNLLATYPEIARNMRETLIEWSQTLPNQ